MRTIVLLCKCQRLSGTGDKCVGHIAAGNFQHTGTALQHIKAGRAVFDFSGWSWYWHASCHFRADCYQPALVFPSLDRGMRKGLSLAVITYGMAEQAGADEDFSHHQRVLP